MVYVKRFGDWFIITNDKGGYGKFLLSADDDSIWVYDVRGKNIMPDIFDYIREIGRQMGLMIKANLDNRVLYRWLKIRCAHDPDVTFDDRLNLLFIRKA